jgi:hypothetical protein
VGQDSSVQPSKEAVLQVGEVVGIFAWIAEGDVISPAGDGRAPRWPGAAEPKRGLVSPSAGRSEPDGNVPAHAQASKAGLCVDRIYRSKDMAFPRKRC